MRDFTERICCSISDAIFRPFSASAVKSRQQEVVSLADGAFRDRMDEIRDRLLNGETESSLAVDTFALVREAAKRQFGFEHRENQLTAAWQLIRRQIVELPTGEGKTLAAIPALVLRALAGRGAWLATANDYLARRDATSMRPVFELLGLSVGYLQNDSTPSERHAAYQCDITYGTIREFGFDYLRDRISGRKCRLSGTAHVPVQRERFSIVVDEADNILLDDARTPLIISEARPVMIDEPVFRWSSITGRMLVADVDYLVEPDSLKVWLTEAGRRRIRDSVRLEILNLATMPQVYDAVARSIEAEHAFLLNRDYVVKDGKVVIVDKLTGRLAEGRQWQNGIQQSLEAANGLPITPETTPVAKITVQAFLRDFEHLSGMTGTAQEDSDDFRRSYGLRIVEVPPFQPCRRQVLPPQVLDTRSEKWDIIKREIEDMRSAGRPVLIGTRDLNASEELSGRLSESHIPHQVLTARQEAIEAELIAGAGQAGMVTVSTSIAGRGTDIRLGPGVAAKGGLHVIAADLFDSSRIDRQLAGRGGRQGDPATYRCILSLEDGLLDAAWDLRTLDRKRQRVLSGRIEQKLDLLRSAQKEVERQDSRLRGALLRSDRERSKRHVELGFDPCLDDCET